MKIFVPMIDPKEIISDIIKYKLQRVLVFYDNPHGCKWNGGRVTSSVNFLDNLRFYNSIGIPVFVCFTNNVININDELGNFYLSELAKFKGNGVIILNRKLNQYIKEKYPTLIRTKTTIDTSDYDDYDLIVLKYDDAIKHNDKERIEVMLNHDCDIKNCWFYKNHYRCIAKYNRIFENPEKLKKCLQYCVTGIQTRKNYKISELIKDGFTNFKLVGRGDNLKILKTRIIDICKDCLGIYD